VEAVVWALGSVSVQILPREHLHKLGTFESGHLHQPGTFAYVLAYIGNICINYKSVCVTCCVLIIDIYGYSNFVISIDCITV